MRLYTKWPKRKAQATANAAPAPICRLIIFNH